MTDKKEAQPEALRLADELIEQTAYHREVAHCCDCRPEDTVNWDHYLQCGNAASELRRQYTEMQQLKAQLTTQTNRAAAAEQQVTGLTQRLDMANQLNTDAREELARLHADHQTRTVVNKTNSSKCVINKDVQWKCGNEYLPYHPDASHVDPAYRDGWNDCYRAAPPTPEREPQPHEKNRELAETAMRFVDRAGDVHPGIDDADCICAEFHAAMAAVVDKWHPMPMPPGIGATND